MFIRTNNRNVPRDKDGTLVNEAIRFKEVRLIDMDGSQLGIMSSRDAKKKAQDHELDLVCVAPQAKPPVCRIMDYGKYRYEQQRSAREARKNQKVVEVKEIRLTPVIDTHDFETKVNRARKFLEKGAKVLVSVRFRGRMIVYTNQGREVLDRFAKACEDIAKVESKSRLENRQIQMTLTPEEKKK